MCQTLGWSGYPGYAPKLQCMSAGLEQVPLSTGRKQFGARAVSTCSFKGPRHRAPLVPCNSTKLLFKTTHMRNMWGPLHYVARSVRPTKSRSRARGRLSCSMQQAFAKPKPIQRLDHIQAHGEWTSVRLHVRYVSQACCPRPRGNLTSHTSLKHKATGQLCAGNAACHALHRVPTY